MTPKLHLSFNRAILLSMIALLAPSANALSFDCTPAPGAARSAELKIYLDFDPAQQNGVPLITTSAIRAFSRTFNSGYKDFRGQRYLNAFLVSEHLTGDYTIRSRFGNFRLSVIQGQAPLASIVLGGATYKAICNRN